MNYFEQILKLEHDFVGVYQRNPDFITMTEPTLKKIIYLHNRMMNGKNHIKIKSIHPTMKIKPVIRMGEDKTPLKIFGLYVKTVNYQEELFKIGGEFINENIRHNPSI